MDEQSVSASKRLGAFRLTTANTHCVLVAFHVSIVVTLRAISSEGGITTYWALQILYVVTMYKSAHHHKVFRELPLVGLRTLRNSFDLLPMIEVAMTQDCLDLLLTR